MGAIGTPGMAGMMHQPQHQALHVDQMEQHPAAMEQFLDHMFSFPPWPEMSTGRSSSPWEYNGAGSAIGLESGSMASLNTAQKLFKLSQTPAAGAMAVSRPQGDGQDGAHLTARDNLQYATQPDDGLLGSRLPQLQALHDRSPGLGSAAAMLSPSVGSSESEGSPGLQGGGRDQSPPAIAPPTWRQPYVVGGGGVPSVPMNLGQTNGDAGNADAFLGKRGRDEADISRDSRSVTTTGLEASFPAYGVQLGQASLVRTGQQTHQQATPPSQGISSVPAVGQAYGAQPASALQQHQGQTQGVPAVAKPRVRARRGQATDPHSIAERLRRERIAERMKSLQELVPNANKTDKASMLDEIIDYVKFLQLQVKVLSMSRLGGPGAVSPLVSDIQPESASSLTTASIGRNTGGTGPPDGLALTERQVARLMEDDMGSAMQYLQSKGLCLMPISLASAISSNGQRPQTVGTTGLVSSSSERQRSEQSVVVSSGGVAAADKARATKDSREAGVESITNMGSAEC